MATGKMLVRNSSSSCGNRLPAPSHHCIIQSNRCCRSPFQTGNERLAKCTERFEGINQARHCVGPRTHEDAAQISRGATAAYTKWHTVWASFQHFPNNLVTWNGT